MPMAPPTSTARPTTIQQRLLHARRRVLDPSHPAEVMQLFARNTSRAARPALALRARRCTFGARMAIRRRQFLGWSAAAAAAYAVAVSRARAAKPAGAPHRVPEGLRLGRRRRVLPGRGRAPPPTARARRSGTCSRASRARSGRTSSGDVACDHYHRYKEDVAIMKSLGHPGLPPQRLVAARAARRHRRRQRQGPRLLRSPDRRAAGRAGITPWVTLYHWDLPLALYHRGGWLNRDVAGWFADYATLIAQALGDRVKHWMPLNEPQVFLGAGLIQGRHAPGDKLRFAEFLLAAHNTLLAHGRAVQALRATRQAAGAHRHRAGRLQLRARDRQRRRIWRRRRRATSRPPTTATSRTPTGWTR